MKKDITKMNLEEFNNTLMSIAKARLGYRQKLVMIKKLVEPLLVITEDEK